MASPPYPNTQNNANAAIPVWIVPPGTGGGGYSPHAGNASVIATGGTAVAAVIGPCNGGYIVNGFTPAQQGIVATENLYIDPVAAPGASDSTMLSTTTALGLGQPYTIPPLASGATIYANAATSNHKFTAVVF
jgi:hypothetical protein